MSCEHYLHKSSYFLVSAEVMLFEALSVKTGFIRKAFMPQHLTELLFSRTS
jgi:hypothetical protein